MFSIVNTESLLCYRGIVDVRNISSSLHFNSAIVTQLASSIQTGVMPSNFIFKKTIFSQIKHLFLLFADCL